jgi:hypothetical protein
VPLSVGHSLTPPCCFAAIGVKISGVDASTYSVTGEAFSAVISPKSTSDVARVLQADDVSLAYEFSRKVSILPAY